ncbi:hypothetical protein [Saccharopolyspora gloriosae]|uniref:Uncharacterized protein n=1 Tax=Saccharopolyspora gloriosae TaxID=455344 RepID=A0A840NCE8_9PSEU|nr:hypothetical protein [Saccharopolyspora gloriosae]
MERRRSARTLESLSTTLGWHPQHLDAVLNGRTPPEQSEDTGRGDSLASRLDAVEDRLAEITERLDDLKTDLRTVAENVRPNR